MNDEERGKMLAEDAGYQFPPPMWMTVVAWLGIILFMGLAILEKL